MQQQSIFGQSAPAVWKLFFDGASRNNPGPSGAGVVALKDGELFFKDGFFLGSKTNNQAEYLACLIGLILLKPHLSPEDHLIISGDSELLIKQLQGAYKVKKEHLKPLHTSVMKLLADREYQLAHVLREDNSQADAMANQGIDQKKELPAKVAAFLKHHGVQI